MVAKRPLTGDQRAAMLAKSLGDQIMYALALPDPDRAMVLQRVKDALEADRDKWLPKRTPDVKADARTDR